MALLKRKQEKTGTISVRVPLTIKAEIAALRPIADTKGFDLAGSLSDAVVKWTKQAREELGINDAPVTKPSTDNHATAAALLK
jgi:hypothetical protein